MTSPSTSELRASLAAAVRDAARKGRGVPESLEPTVREYAKRLRLDGVPVEKALIDVKALARAEGGADEPIIMPRLVGWAVAGYFAGTAPEERSAGE